MSSLLIQIADRLQANKWDVLDPDNFAFIVVRHPLDRLISAFTDRILNTDTGQSKYHTKRILKHGRNSTQKKPTFNQFLSYIAAGGTDTHWSPYYKDCSPCQVQYDWIIKLEDENICKYLPSSQIIHLLHPPLKKLFIKVFLGNLFITVFQLF